MAPRDALLLNTVLHQVRVAHDNWCIIYQVTPRSCTYDLDMPLHDSLLTEQQHKRAIPRYPLTSNVARLEHGPC
jgi:hypothetical protein